MTKILSLQCSRKATQTSIMLLNPLSVAIFLELSEAPCKRYGKRLVSIYSRLWSFGVRTLRLRESGLNGASDLLLGDHLTEKSVTVKWIDISMPNRRNCRLKEHKELQEIEVSNLDTEDIFEDIF